MKAFDEIDVEALRTAKQPPLDLCMMGAAKMVLQTLCADGWKYVPKNGEFYRQITEEVWTLYGDMRGYPNPMVFCGCEIDGRYDHWADRTFYRMFLPKDCTAPEAQPLLKLLKEQLLNS